MVGSTTIRKKVKEWLHEEIFVIHIGLLFIIFQRLQYKDAWARFLTIGYRMFVFRFAGVMIVFAYIMQECVRGRIVEVYK